MYAHVMRKWSLIKLLMLLFLPIMILLFYCQGGVNAMYLSTPRQQIQQQLHYNPYYAPQQNTQNFQGVEEKRYYSNENSNRFLSESNNNNNNNNIYNNRKVDNHDSKNGDEMDDDSGEEEKKKNLLSIKSDRNLIRSDNNLSNNNNNNNINSNSYLHENNPHAIQNYLWIKRMQEKKVRHENFRHMSSRIATSSSPSLSLSSIINQTENENLNSISSHISSLHVSNNLNTYSSNYRNRRDSSSLSNTNSNNSNNNNKRKRNNTNKLKPKNKNKTGKLHIKKRRNLHYCSAHDPEELAFMAPTVFSGKVLSMTSDRSSNFSVTFELQGTIKLQKNGTLPNQIRLQFRTTNKFECDINKEKLRSIANITQELKPREIYYLFVNQITKTEFTILGQPIKENENVISAIKKGIKKKYGQNATIQYLRYEVSPINSTRDQQIDVNSKIRLVCKFKGRPAPKITWYFNQKKIKNLPNFEVKTKSKSRSILIIKSANINDTGNYECRARNNISKVAREIIKIRVNQKRDINPNEEISGKTSCDSSIAYCHNGGTCMHFRQISEISCQCHEAYSGQRCEHKVPSNSTLPSLYSLNR